MEHPRLRFVNLDAQNDVDRNDTFAQLHLESKKSFYSLCGHLGAVVKRLDLESFKLGPYNTILAKTVHTTGILCWKTYVSKISL